MPPYKITLCRVATRGNPQDTNLQFHSQNQIWLAEPFLRTELQKFLEVMGLVKADKRSSDIDFKVENLGEDLVVTVTVNPFMNRIKRRNYWLQQLMPILFDNYVPELTEVDIEEIKQTKKYETAHLMRTYVTTQLYDMLYNSYLNREPNISSDNYSPLKLPACFMPILCNFQELTVRWLLQREQQQTNIPCMYNKLHAKDNTNAVYKHRWCFDFQIDSTAESINLPPGGILADEMGLGKTVEILALILLNKPKLLILHSSVLKTFELPKKKRRTDNEEIFCICRLKNKKGMIQCTRCFRNQHINCVTRFNKDHTEDINNPYYCPNCWSELTEDELFPTAATFIVTPNIIKNQWVSEVRRHIQPTLKIFLYNGSVTKNWISPRQLANYDIVLTDYNALRSDFHLAGLNKSDRKTRNKPIAMQLKTPLVMLKWWRVCLDEAQMVESNTSHLSKLLSQVPAVNRWAVTGTPIQNSIDDLLSLFRFIGITEFCEPIEAWNNLVRDFVMFCGTPNRRFPLIDNVLSKCMWRTCKTRVDDELKLPPQAVRVHRIMLSDIEMFYYEQQHKQCHDKFRESVQKYMPIKNEDATISPQIMRQILHPVLKIRQCCSVSVVKSGASGPVKQFLQPKELHAHLKAANEIECRAELRAMASSYNGKAGIFFLCNSHDEAVKNYLEVLQLAKRYAEYNFTVDSLLQIHALHNLIVANHITKCSGLNIETFKKQLNELEWIYIEPNATALKSARKAYEDLEKEREQLQANAGDNFETFLSTAGPAIRATDSNTKFALLAKTLAECEKLAISNYKLERFQYLDEIILALRVWADEITFAKVKLTNGFENLKFFTDNLRISSEIDPAIWQKMSSFVSSVYQCHLREARENFDSEEKRLIFYKEQQLHKEENLCTLCRMKQEQGRYECLLFNKQYNKFTNQTDGFDNPSMEICLIKALLVALKAKPYNLCDLIPQLEKHLKIIECEQAIYKKIMKYWIELEYAVKAYDELNMCKMRISLAEKEEDVSHFRVMKYQLSEMLVEQTCNLNVALMQFNIKLGRLKYFKHLEKARDELTCPICQSDDKNQYAVLECGHSLCMDCYKLQCNFIKTNTLTCSICRHQQQTKKAHYLTCKENSNNIKMGEFSAKLTYIINLIFELKKKEPSVKILIYSEWQPILKAIANAFDKHNIKYRLQLKPRDIDEFKDPKLGITCLLLPFSKGSKGINLIQATHVFLVEPILNPAEELQAIGRVHRIGQTKPTTVHRFIVNKTIEENIFNLILRDDEHVQRSWEFENMKVEEIYNLFELPQANE